MANLKNKGSKVERLVDIMFSGAAVPAESMDKMRRWLADPDKEEEKSAALYGKFIEIFKYNPKPVLALQLWPDLARRLGMDETPVAATYDCLAAGPAEAVATVTAHAQARRKRSFGWIARRVAAVLLPVAIVAGTVWWMSDRGSGTVAISVPYGSVETIILPDGSTVEAEGGATVSYDEKTFADHRLVTLKGEALFDVVEIIDEDGLWVPFTVEADNLTVNVLGTVFKFAGAGGGSEVAAVSLYEGSVEVAIEAEDGGGQESETILHPGERLRVNTLTGEHNTELIPASEMAMYGAMPLLRFEEATLGDVILALEMNHDVEFDLAEGIDRGRGQYTANFEGIALDEVLDMLSEMDTDLSFEMVGRRILVTPRTVKTDNGAGAVSTMWIGDVDEAVVTEMITFRSGSAVSEARFMDNARALKELDSRLTDTAVLARIDHISVTAASSPDGNTANNERLAIARAQSTKGYLVKKYPHIAPEKVHTFSVGEEWSGLRRLVYEDMRTPDRDEVLSLLDNVPDEEKRDSLPKIGGGRPWRYIVAHHLPRLRGATAVTLHFWDAESQRRTDTVSVSKVIGAGTGVQRVEIVAAKPEPIPVEEPIVELPVVEPRPLFAVKTNLLFDAASALNLEVEVPLGKKWSLAAEGIFPWWMMVGGTLEGRYWWGDRTHRPSLTGWFTGIYAGGGSYDLNWRSRAREGNFFHAGFSGGYAHTVNRRGNLRMEYSLGVGYLWGTRTLENPREKYGWMGPTRAKVSLVLMLDRKSSNQQAF